MSFKMSPTRFAVFVLCASLLWSVEAEKGKEADEKKKAADKWKKKSILDYSEADIERLYDQWEDADEDKLEEDELPEWKRKPPAVDMSKIDPKNPESILKMSKKGRTLMMFVTVSGNPTEKETEAITLLWHTSLFNAHLETQRYVVAHNRVLFMLTDGSTAWEVKDFLVEQDRCEVVTIDNKDYPGKGAPKTMGPDNKTKKDTKKEEL